MFLSAFTKGQPRAKAENDLRRNDFKPSFLTAFPGAVKEQRFHPSAWSSSDSCGH